MKVALFDYDRRHSRWLEVPDTFSPPHVLLVDGVPYIADGENCYRIAASVRHIASNEPIIEMAKLFKHPVQAEANSTRWFNGCVGEAKVELRVDIELPWFDAMKLSVTSVRAIRVHGVWSPDCDDKVLSISGRQSVASIYGQYRRATNEFCNKYRPRDSKLMLTMLGVDLNGRIVCEIHKHIAPAFGQPGEVLSLRKRLLDSGFLPAQWRLP